MIDKTPHIIQFPGPQNPDDLAELLEEQEMEAEQRAHRDKAATDGESMDEKTQSSVDAAMERVKEEEKESVWQVSLPTALAHREVKLYLGAVATVLATIVLTIMTQSPQMLVLLAFAAFFVYMGLSSRMDFRDGKIKELTLLCYNVQKVNMVSASRNVSFCTNEEVPTYYRFVVQDKKGEFFPGVPYLVYFHENRPQQLLAFYQL